MPQPQPRLALSFTGGKDCMLALHLLAGSHHPVIPPLCDIASDTPLHIKPSWPASHHEATQGTATPPTLTPTSAAAASATTPGNTSPSAATGTNPVVLLVTFAPAAAPGGPPGSSFKAHPIDVIKAQAEALGLPHVVCEVGAPYLERYASEITRLKDDYGITGLVTGDIEDVAAGFMAAATAAACVPLITPLWQVPREQLLQVLLDLDVSARISCVALRKFAAPADSPASQEGENGKEGGTDSIPKGLQQQQQQQDKQAVEQRRHNQQQGQEGKLEQQGQQEQQEQQGQQGQRRRQEGSGGCHCLCSLPAWVPPKGPPPFDAVGELLGQPLTRGLIDGPLARAVRLTGIDLGGEDGSYHTVVTACPLMAGRVLTLEGQPYTGDAATGYVYMVWDKVCISEPQ